MKNEQLNEQLVNDFKNKSNNAFKDVDPKDVGKAGSALVELIQAGIKIWRDIMK